jgi:hypothetical protein
VRRITALFVAGLFVASLAVPAVAVAKPGPSVYVVPTGNSPDDTAAIQTALSACSGAGPGCVVQLQAGTYYTKQLVAYNFNGTFKGAGEGQTMIQALPDLVVSYSPGCQVNLTDCLLPSLITFVDGNVGVSDLALDFPATNGTETTAYSNFGPSFIGVVTALDFEGDGAYNASVGFSVMQGIMFDGWYPAALGSLNNATRSGTFSVRNSTVSTVWTAMLVQGAVMSSQVSIVGNQISNVDIGLDLGAANSTFDVSNNNIAADFADPVEWDHYGIFVEPSGGVFAGLVSRLSQFSIHDNNIVVSDTCGCNMIGMWLFDAIPPMTAHWFTATVKHNTISLPANYILGANGKAGIAANNITGTTISGNTITAAPAGTYEGIGLWGNDPSWLPSTGNSVIANDLSGVMLDPTPGVALAQVYLDPYAANNHVVCAGQGVSVLDQGTSNMVTGCGPANSKGGGFHHAFAPGQVKPKLHP